MKLPRYLGLAIFLILLTAASSSAQGNQQQAPAQPAQPSNGGNRGSSSPQPSNQQNRETTPMYVEGRVITDSGQAAPSPVSVRLSCGSTTVQTIRTDSKGYFRFTLGMGAQSNFDFSAADEQSSPFGSFNPSNIPGCANTGLGSMNGMSLTGWEVRISVPGYQPLMQIITETPSLGTVDLGVLELRSTASVAPGAVSVTSLLVPNNARKEYDQGIKEMQSKRLPQAQQHFEKAVAVYDKYAAAWTDLGRVYASQRQFDKAGESYNKAIAADPKYAPPYMSLGALKLEARDYQGALENASKAVELDPNIEAGVGGYIEAVANYSLDHLDAAEKNLVVAQKGPHQNIPQLHAMFADLYLRKNDTANAAPQIRAYLKEAPQGPFADDLKTKLQEIEKDDTSGSSGKQTIAP